MAEWRGRKQRQRNPGDPMIVDERKPRPGTIAGVASPGATSSPQLPGATPDRSEIPGHFATRIAPSPNPRRPLSEMGTSQGIMGIYGAPEGKEMDPARFEQATAAYEELRKAYPVQLPPTHPSPGYALATGDAMASELQAIDGPKPAPSAPASATGEAATAAPGAPTGASGAPARTDAPASQVGSAFSPSDAPASVRSPDDAAAGAGAVTGGGAAGESRWAEAAPKPGDDASPGGVLPPAKEQTGDTSGTSGAMPSTAPQ